MQEKLKESQRIERLRELLILDSEPEPVFDSIVKLASDVCGVPIALVSLVDTERQWFKANIGLPGVNETPREVAFCAHAILGDALLEVPDATSDARFLANSLVTGQPGIRFYAGAPLVLPGGERVGTLCVFDRQARQLDDSQKKILASLAKIATEALLARRDLIQRAASVRSEYEQTVADSEARYRVIVEAQAELVSLAQADGTLVFVNTAYASCFCQTPQQIQGRNLFDFITVQDRAAVAAQLGQVWESGQSQSNVNRMVAQDGSLRWVSWTNTLERDPQGRSLLHSVGRDVTDRKRSQLALEESQAMLARTGRIAGVGGWQLDLASGTLGWSDETRRIHEVDANFQPTLDTAVNFYADGAREQVEQAVQRAMADGTPWDLELPLITAKGRNIWVRAQGEVEFEGGKPVRLAGAFQDISERRQLLDRLADNERFMRQVTDGLPLRIAYLDGELRFQFVNRENCQRFGRPREAILGHTLVELTGRGNDAMVAAKVQAVLDGEAQHFEYEEATDSGVRRFASHLIPDLASDGRLRGFYSTGIDITERSAAERALRELTEIIDNTTDFVVQTDWRGNISYLNPAARRLQGIAPIRPLDGLNFASFFDAHTSRRYFEEIAPIVKRDGVWIGESTCFAAGREVPVSQIIIAHRDAQGRVARYSSVMRDRTEQHKAEQELARQTATLRSVAEAIPASVAVVGRDQRYRFVNNAFERWAGVPREQLIGHDLARILGSSDLERSRPWIERALSGESVQFEREYDGRNGPTHIAVSYIPLWMESGKVDGFVAVLQDISQHKREEVRLLQLAQRDALTGLLNRSGFEQQMEHEVATGNGSSLALLYIDLDHFKSVNDRYGHPVGDQLLQQVAQRLAALVRPSDAVARLGGDEFAILLSAVRTVANARAVADKVIAAAQEPFHAAGHDLHIGASVGVAFGVDLAAGWPDLVKRADARLYEAKNAGRGRQAGAHV
jgi:diguanylate cyclase (GGDEF)-like protein/PAS domain S-box-containing protein